MTDSESSSTIKEKTTSTYTTEKTTTVHTDEKQSPSISSYLYIQMEYCKNGTLEDLIRKGDVFYLINRVMYSYIKIKQEYGRLWIM